MVDVVIVEDDKDLAGSVVRYLSLVGMNIKAAGSGAEMNALLASTIPDVLILDVNLPGEDGFSIASRLREHTNMRIIMLTARQEVDSRVLGRTAGADVYLTKPVELRELEATIHSLYRRIQQGNDQSPSSSRPPERSCWSFDATDWSVISPNGSRVVLTTSEYRVIQLFLSKPGVGVTREELGAALGKKLNGYDDRSIDALIARLRKKIQQASGEEIPIRTARSVGYVFAVQSAK
jgi:two-component system OmpR family response regulator